MSGFADFPLWIPTNVSTVCHWQRDCQREHQVLLTKDRTEWEQYMTEFMEKEVRITVIQRQHTSLNMQTFTLHHLTDISPTCLYLFPAEGAGREEEQSGGVRGKNSQSYFGDYSQEQPAPDRAEHKVSGLHHSWDATHLLTCIKLCLAQRYSVPVSHLQVLQREHQKTKANRIILRLKQIKQEDEVVTHNFTLSNIMSRTIR